MSQDNTETIVDRTKREHGQPPGPIVKGTAPHRAVTVAMVGSVLTAIANVVSTFVIPRLLGPAYYGAFSLFVSFRETTVSLSEMGLSASLARCVPLLEKRPDWPRILGTLFALQMTVAAVLTTVAAILLKASLGPLGTPVVLGIAVVCMLFGSALGFVVALAYGRNLITAVTTITVLGAAIGVLFIPVCYLALGFVGAFVAGLFSLGVLWTFAWSRTRPWNIGRPSGAVLQQALAIMFYGAQAFFGGLIWLLFTRGASFILAATHQPMEEIGRFAAGFNPAMKLTSMVGSASSALLPAMAAVIMAGNISKARLWASTLARYVTATAMVLVSAVGFLGLPLLVTVLGRKYSGVDVIAAFCIAAVLPLVLDRLARQVAVAWGYACLSVEVFVVVCILFVGTGLELSSQCGSLGIVMAVIVASVGAAVYSNVRLRMWTGLWPLGWTWLLAAALGAPTAISFLVEMSWPVRVVGFVGFCCYYAVLLVSLGVTPLGEFREFWHGLRYRSVEKKE